MAMLSPDSEFLQDLCLEFPNTANPPKSAGTLSDPDGHFFIKPCTKTEVDFYQSAIRDHPDFAELMPLFMGTLQLNDASNLPVDSSITGAVDDNGTLKTTNDQMAAAVAEQVAAAPLDAPKDSSWVPTRGKKIKTDQSVVLENASAGFKKPNILDTKLGVRLWADDAPQEKKTRFDKITGETTHGSLGFRIAGMRVFRGSDNASELDDEEYMVYNKDFGRFHVNNDNIAETFRKFIFNRTAGIDEELGKAVCEAFARDVQRVEDVMSKHESRMYSASLLFVFEGDGPSLRNAIEKNNASIEGAEAEKQRIAKRVDSGIAMEDDDDDELELGSLPQIYSVRLIDFAHATWTPGQGPDENSLKGVRSLKKLFGEMAQ